MKFVALAFVLLLAGCSSAVKRGTVAMKIDQKTAHVALNREEVSVGDHVALFASVCSLKSDIDMRTCRKVLKGHGIVSKVLSNSYSEVVFDDGVQFSEGNFIEKHVH